MLRWQQIDVDIDVEIQVITGGYATVTVLLTIVIGVFTVVIRRVIVTGIDLRAGGGIIGGVAFLTFTGIVFFIGSTAGGHTGTTTARRAFVVRVQVL